MPPAALITGAADRIGAAIAARLAAEGYAVVIHYRSSGEKAEDLADAIAADGGHAEIVQADLAKREDRMGLIASATEPFGPLTVLINNASVFEPDSADTLHEDLWDLHMAIHAEAPVFLSRDFAAQLPDDEKGNVVNIIDERVLSLSPDYFSYTLSKSVLWTATRTLAQSLAPRIRVNAIGPGPTLANSRQSDAEFEASRQRLPLQTGADPEEIAEGVVSILNLPSMTGQMIALDGGEHLEWSARNAPTPRKQ
ncbi:SDR family oxidoreductase [Pelagibacterium halotolerans]|uniref:FolM Alternative dihydrofolate reductase 1 n=1 Tax=Pelagibacterium halotolerans (strain DSM 22347 / JCM 15775 / CGMCC 1.7692 / B2) TaxID=1082931 RepID=G4R676_PELHB|nr:SDR family oxidoreductase [Pelagibacterium halotolerans]AEQ52169.1 FolM Alternative dihydrofolate reductase 1 [Pelagibacterium halotolerans B2]QJR18070.1 SDR family oxidoreductase [Pelagibacterium halotolerans]SDZ84927.1 NAD(P)-dependent dehydrogenase, short-chain alcohol dehydrogenase family [Pelagibacterium halotolerans]